MEKLPRQIKRSYWLRKYYESWYPDIWLSNPEKFVENLGNGEWGKTVALNLWLKYYDLGYLDTGHNSVSKYLFEQYLTELSKSNKTL